MNLSSCGIDCDACEFKVSENCPGCQKVKGKPFWAKDGGRCDLYICAEKRNLAHCGNCGDFACDMLKEWAKEGDGERIRNLENLIKINQNGG